MATLNPAPHEALKFRRASNQSNHPAFFVRLRLLNIGRMDLAKLPADKAAGAVDRKFRATVALQSDPDRAGRDFRVICDLVNEIFVRGVFEQCRRSKGCGCHAMNLARALPPASRALDGF